MKKKSLTIPIVFLYGIAGFGLFLFSYTQVDLGLTLVKFSIFQVIEKAFQHVGYFNRPLSVGLYLVLLLAFFLLYWFVIYIVKRKYMNVRGFWSVVGVLTVILVFSYPAFSYDMFNYMFTAKTVLVYHKNPYTVIPLQFTGVEPWLGFMHWTHLPSAYTPLWILLTLPAYALGFGYFLAIMWNIKILVAGLYILTIWCIGKILDEVDPKNKVLGMVLFALNPLVIFETLVSGHNDVVMMAFAMFSYVLYLQKKHLASFFTLSLSIASKLMTLFVLPAFFLGWKRKWALWGVIIGFILVAFQRDILPWYVVWLVPFYAIIPETEWAATIGAGLSLGFLLSYVPFFYYGNYDAPVSTIKLWVTVIPIIASVLWVGARRIRFK